MKSVFKKFTFYWLPVLTWAILIFILSSISNLKTDLSQDFLLRKVAHMVEFAILTLLLYRAIKNETGKTNKTIIYSLIIALLYAFSDEFHQSFVFGRYGSITDVGIDSIGIFIFSLVCYIKNKRLKSKN